MENQDKIRLFTKFRTNLAQIKMSVEEILVGDIFQKELNYSKLLRDETYKDCLTEEGRNNIVKR